MESNRIPPACAPPMGETGRRTRGVSRRGRFRMLRFYGDIPAQFLMAFKTHHIPVTQVTVFLVWCVKSKNTTHIKVSSLQLLV